MQETLSTLFDLTINLADIKHKLGQEWPAFARRMETQAALFNNLPGEADLTGAVNKLLLDLFLDGGRVEDIMTRPDAPKISQEKSPNPQAPAEVRLHTPRNSFYLFWKLKRETGVDPQTIADCFRQLCQDPDRVANQVWPKAPAESEQQGKTV